MSKLEVLSKRKSSVVGVTNRLDSGIVEYVDKLSDVSSSDEEESSKISIKKPEPQNPKGFTPIDEHNTKINQDIVGEEGTEPNIWVAEYLGNNEKKIQV